MRWCIVWRSPDPGAPWRLWSNTLHTSRTLAWDAVIRDRGWKPIEGRPGWYTRGNPIHPTDRQRDAILRHERHVIGLRVVPVMDVKFWDPDHYAECTRRQRVKA